MPRRVIFIGKPDAPEFQQAIQWLRQHVVLQCVETISTATEQLIEGPAADTILVAPSYRTEFTLEDVRRLQAASPLSHLWVVVGSWCEGETRSGKAWPGIARLYVHQLIPRAQSDGWDRAASDTPALPGTASSDEHWLARAAKSRRCDAGFVLVCGPDKDSRSTLVELCRWAGFETVSMQAPRRPDGNPIAVIYDADSDPEQRGRDLRRLSRELPASRLVTLIEYPRHDEIRQALDAGSDLVLGKPYDIDDLLACLVDPGLEVDGCA